ncbi:hypothetical protein Tco_1031652 [Tanacetum coccineum]|uniref:Gag-Pol polyprotein n=1 Tax=Tanacetum coccineum TaxID=301880 RepID=A0ABQ5GA02_9ASTR
MLAPGRYAQWLSRFMRYIDTRSNGEALKKCILQGPYKLSNVKIPAELATKTSPAVPERPILETFSNITPENKAHYDSQKKAIHLLLTRIGDEIYSTVDACKTAHNIFTLRDGESMESYYSRFYKMMNEMQTQDLDTLSYHKLFDILKQYQKKVNEIRAKKIARNANPLALVSDAQQYPDPYYQAPKPHKSYASPAKTSPSTKSHASTRHKGKEIAKPITPPSESASDEDSDPEQAQKDKEMQKNLALTAKYFKKLYKPTNNNLRTSSNFKNKNVDTTPRYVNDNQTGQFGNQRTVTVVGARETVGTEKGVHLQAEQADWLEDTDEEIDEQELEAHYSYMAKIQEVLTADSGSDVEPLEKVQYDAEYNVFANERQHSKQPESINDTHKVEKDDSNVIPDSSNMCDNDNQADQNAKEWYDERAALANLIANLTLDTEENKKISKQLKKENASLTQ